MTKLLISTGAFLALCVAIGTTSSEDWLTAWWPLLVFVALPMLVISWVELGRALR